MSAATDEDILDALDEGATTVDGLAGRLARRGVPLPPFWNVYLKCVLNRLHEEGKLWINSETEEVWSRR
jgi:hypothetical protein